MPDESATLIHGVEYPIYTPYGSEEAAQVLMDFLKAFEIAEAEKEGKCIGANDEMPSLTSD